MKISFGQDIQISKKQFILIASLVVNSISWYYLMTTYLESLLTQSNLSFGYLGKEAILASFFLFIALSSVAGVIMFPKSRMKSVLVCWIIVDIATFLLPSLLGPRTYIELLIFAAMLGFSVGFGFPKCLTYFSNSTSIEERGRVGGAMIFLTYLLTPLLLVATQSLASSMRLATYAGWRALGLGAIPFIQVTDSDESLQNEATDRQQFTQRREFLLYFIPWVTFSLINGIDTHVYGKFHSQETIETGLTLIHLSGSFCSILAGIALDFVGRRTSITFAMVILGLGFVALSFAQTSLVSWFFFSITTGVAWGVLSIAYILVLWGELGSREKREKYYAIGMIPFFLSQAVGYILSPMLSGFSSIQLFSTATLLNFLAVIPLLFAEEVLPSRTMEQRRMRDYIKRAKQLTGDSKRH